MLSTLKNGGDTTMPGDYAPMPRVGPQRTVNQQPETPQPIISRKSFKKPSTSMVRPSGARRTRRRSLTPEIVIEKSSRRCCNPRRSCVFTVPLDCRPTLGLRGPPRRYLEIERIRCRRRRRRRSPCDDHDKLNPQQPPQAFLLTNPAPQVSVVPQMLTAAVPVAPKMNALTVEMIQSLPRKTVHLPPIHLPGSQANENTPLQTVILPAEFINPIDGSLSIIQAMPMSNANVAVANVQPSMIVPIHTVNQVPVQPSMIIPSQSANLASTKPSPVNLANNPLRDRFLQLFQRLKIPQTRQPSPPPISSTVAGLPPNQPVSLNTNQPVVDSFQSSIRRPTTRPMAQFDPNQSSNQPIRSSYTATETNQPFNSINRTEIRPAYYRDSQYPPENLPMDYSGSSFTATNTTNKPNYLSSNQKPPTSSDIGPYSRANITPYTNTVNRLGNSQFLVNRSVPTRYSAAAPTATTEPVNSNTTGNYTNILNRETSNNNGLRSILRNREQTTSTNL